MANSLHQATLDAQPLLRSAVPFDAGDRMLTRALDEVTDGLFVVDGVGTIVFANKVAEHLLGETRAEIVGAEWNQRRWQTRMVDGAIKPVEDSFEPNCRVRRTIARHNGSAVEVSCWFRHERDELGRTIGTIITLTDITNRLRVEEQLRNFQKAEAIGLLASGIAHDLNNYLTTIVGNVCLVRDQMSAEMPAWRLLADCEKAGWQAADLIKQLLSLARRKPPQLRPMDLRQVVHDTVNIFRRTLPPTITVEELGDPAAWPVLADSGQVGQVVLNLCTNARDAMPTGGRLVIESTNATAGRGPLGASREFVRLSVTDTGHGIGEDVRARMFEPFFTTKPNGKGTGLGLSVAFDIIQAHGGWIDCLSELGTGTRMDVYFPRWQPAPARAQSN